MDIIHNNIHMDMVKCRAVSQMTLEDDMNLPQDNPDLDKIIFREGTLNLTDTVVTNDHVLVKGQLLVTVLYLSEDEEERLARTTGKLSFEENVYLEGIQQNDTVDVTWKIEDLSVSMINSRKISARSMITLTLQSDQLYDEEAAVDLTDAEGIEFHKKQMDMTSLAVCKRDIYRIRQDLELPASMPNFYHVIWQSIRIASIDMRPLEEKIAVSGELSVFLLYESMQDGDHQYYETTLPFSGTIDCQGSREMMIPDIRYTIASREAEVRPDLDGEERCFSMELVLDLSIKLYEQQQISVIEDVYGTHNEVRADVKDGSFRHMLLRNSGKCRVTEKRKIEHTGAILQLIHSEGEVYMESTSVQENGIEVEGIVHIKSLYVTSDDRMPYAAFEDDIPFSYLLEAKAEAKDCEVNLQVTLEQLGVTMLDGQEIEIRMTIDVAAVLLEPYTMQLVRDVEILPLDKEKFRALPGIAVYVAKPDDSLWQIGKKYYMPVARIKELNGLTTDMLKGGEKLLLVKER